VAHMAFMLEAERAEKARRDRAKAAAEEKKKAEKAAFEAKVAMKRRSSNIGVAANMEALLQTLAPGTDSSPGALTERARRKSPRRKRIPALDTVNAPIKTGLESFRSALTARESRSEPRRVSEWGKVMTKKSILLRSEPGLDSETAGELAGGSLIELFEACHLEDGTRRVRTAKGWCTSVSREGKVLVGPAVIVHPEYASLFPSAHVHEPPFLRLPHRAWPPPPPPPPLPPPPPPLPPPSDEEKQDHVPRKGPGYMAQTSSSRAHRNDNEHSEHIPEWVLESDHAG